MDRLSLSLRITAYMALSFAAAALAQLAALHASHALSPAHLGSAVASLLAPLGVAAAVSTAGVAYVARRSVRHLERAIRRIESGDYGARLPAPVNRDFAAIQDAFSAMAQALDRAMARLREGDLQRRRMFADLAHELATPAGAVVGLADTLALGSLGLDDATRARLLAALGEESMRLGTLIRDLSDLAHMEDPEVSLRCEPGDARRLLLRVARGSEAEAQGVPIECELAEAPLGVLMDAARVEQVMINLLSNARRYTPDGGRVRVSAGRDGEEVWIRVQDDGPGVPEGLLPRLGERLLRADASRDRRTGGHGLGLSIVRAIVSRHRGRIEFANAPEGGLRVTVRLPAVDLS